MTSHPPEPQAQTLGTGGLSCFFPSPCFPLKRYLGLCHGQHWVTSSCSEGAAQNNHLPGWEGEPSEISCPTAASSSAEQSNRTQRHFRTQQEMLPTFSLPEGTAAAEARQEPRMLLHSPHHTASTSGTHRIMFRCCVLDEHTGSQGRAGSRCT